MKYLLNIKDVAVQGAAAEGAKRAACVIPVGDATEHMDDAGNWYEYGYAAEQEGVAEEAVV